MEGDLIQNQMEGFDSTLQNFIYKHTVDLGNVQKGIRKREKFHKHQVRSN